MLFIYLFIYFISFFYPPRQLSEVIAQHLILLIHTFIRDFSHPWVNSQIKYDNIVIKVHFLQKDRK